MLQAESDTYTFRVCICSSSEALFFKVRSNTQIERVKISTNALIYADGKLIHETTPINKVRGIILM
jgi:hypothetical protein